MTSAPSRPLFECFSACLPAAFGPNNAHNMSSPPPRVSTERSGKVPEGVSPTSVTEYQKANQPDSGRMPGRSPAKSPAKSPASSPARGSAPAPPARKIQVRANSPAVKEEPEAPGSQPRRKLSDNPFMRRDSEEERGPMSYQTPAQLRKAEAAKRAEAEAVEAAKRKAVAEAEKQLSLIHI